MPLHQFVEKQLVQRILNGNEIKKIDTKKYLIERREDVKIVTDQISNDIKKYLLPYFDQHSSIEQIDKILNSNLKNLIVHNFAYPHRAMMGLIAAKLTKNPNYDQIVAVYDEELIPASEDAKKEYESLKILLDQIHN